MPEKLSKAFEIILQVLISFGILLVSASFAQQITLLRLNKTLVICEIILFVIAAGLNLFHFVRLSFAMLLPPLCLRQACKTLKWLLLGMAVISGNYVFLSLVWYFSYDQQTLIESIDLFYNLLELTVATFGILLALFANTFITKQRSEPVSECQS